MNPLIWDVEVRLLNTETGAEKDYMSIPYKSEYLTSVFARIAHWYPVKPPMEAALVIRQRSTGKEIRSKILLGTDGRKHLVSVKGELLRPRDAIRVLMHTVEEACA